jgi:hypothetical protein
LPREEVTPPVTKTYFAMVRYLSHRLGVATVTARKQGGQSGLLGKSVYRKRTVAD